MEEGAIMDISQSRFLRFALLMCMKTLLLFTMFGILFGVSTAADDKKIFIKFNSRDKFDVLYHRVESTATGAVIFGLIGAGIEEGVRSNKDKEKKSQILEHMDNPSCNKKFLSSLQKKLTDKGYESKLVKDGDNNNVTENDLLLEVKTNLCGFKMVDTTADKVAAFINFSADLKKDGKSIPFDENYTFTGKKSYSFHQLLDSDVNLDNEFEDVLVRAGKRLANKVIYRKGEK